MADVQLSNIASVTGIYDYTSTTIVSEPVITELITGLTITKTADKENWASGNLTYTITITNDAESSFENPTVTDILDINLIGLVEGSVQVNGEQAQYTYIATRGILTIQLDTIEVGETTVITFQVQKV